MTQNAGTFAEFQCAKSKLCLPRWLVMDGKADCNVELFPDNSDEQISFTSCKHSEFSCVGNQQLNNSSLRCIPREWVADGDQDCADGLDEQTKFHRCNNDSEYFCVNDGRCIPRYRVLDGVNDCSDGSDERHPLICLPMKEFRCHGNGRCIPRSWRGNKMINCIEGSDELPMASNESCVDGEVECKNKTRCIPLSLLCDEWITAATAATKSKAARSQECSDVRMIPREHAFSDLIRVTISLIVPTTEMTSPAYRVSSVTSQ